MAYLLNQTQRRPSSIRGGYILGNPTNIPFNQATPSSESLENIEKYNQQLLDNGIEPPKRKSVLGTVNKILNVLRTGEYAVGGILAGKGPITGIREEISPSEVFGITPTETKSFIGLLKQPSFYGALAVDILFDPTTYLTFGFGSGAKISTKVGEKILNKEGTGLLKKAINQFGEDSARRMIATTLLREGGEKYLKTGGLKFMGKEFLPRNIVTAPFRYGDDLLEKTPLVGISYKATKDVLNQAFKPFAKINELPSQMGGDGRFEEMVLGTQKGIRGETKRQMESILALQKASLKAAEQPTKKGIGSRLLQRFGLMKAEEPLLKEPGRQITNLIEFDERTGNKVLDDIADYMSEQLKVMGFAEKKRMILGENVPVHIAGYQRHLLTEEGRKFLEEGGQKIQSEFIGNLKEFRVKAPFAIKRKLEDTITNINNLYKEKHGIKLFEEDAFKAFAQRTAEHIKATKMYDFFKNLGDERIAIRAPVVPQLSRTPKGLTTVNKTLTETSLNGIKYITTKIPQLEGQLIPEPIAKHLDMVYGMMTKEPVAKNLLDLYDNVLNFWKGSVTGWFPAFHSRNALGGVFNNWIAGLTNPTWYKRNEDLLKGKPVTITDKISGKVYGRDELIRLSEDMGITGAPGMIDVMRDIDEMVRIGHKSGLSHLKEFPRTAMEAVEDRIRMPLFMWRLSEGDTPLQAAKSVFRYHFDYAPEAFTAFERNVMKRIIPFYTWTRNNIPLQFQELVRQPGKYAGLEKTRREIEKFASVDAEEEEQYLPQWMKEMFVFRLPGESKEGLARYLQLDLPLEDINKMPFTESGRRELIALLSPFIKYPVERIANRNLYFGSEIYDASVPREYQTSKAIEALKFLPQPIKEYLNFKETQLKNPFTGQLQTGYEMDALRLHAIRSVLAGRFYSTIGTATDSELDVWQKLSRILGGVPVRAVNIEEEQYRRLKEQESLDREVVRYLQRRGTIPLKGQKQPIKSGYILDQ